MFAPMAMRVAAALSRPSDSTIHAVAAPEASAIAMPLAIRAANSQAVLSAIRKATVLTAAAASEASTTGRRPIWSERWPQVSIAPSEPTTYAA
ncbi:MAG TPA: hypothetical protein VFP65_15645 [Anaeromyxobacteraceae bacterium]|nr:hypothetical protein [Anaeromyxobacteraceae bacterium]